MSDDSGMLGGLAVACKVCDDQRTIRMHLPPLQLAGVWKSISIFVDMGAGR
jgi:hypothetical protein